MIKPAHFNKDSEIKLGLMTAISQNTKMGTTWNNSIR
jgi:hypothetical protein